MHLDDPMFSLLALVRKITNGRHGLAVTCLTTVYEILRLNRTVGSFIYHDRHCVIQRPWAQAAHPCCSA